jgi:hypothetical protein
MVGIRVLTNIPCVLVSLGGLGCRPRLRRGSSSDWRPRPVMWRRSEGSSRGHSLRPLMPGTTPDTQPSCTPPEPDNKVRSHPVYAGKGIHRQPATALTLVALAV